MVRIDNEVFDIEKVTDREFKTILALVVQVLSLTIQLKQWTTNEDDHRKLNEKAQFHTF